MSLETKMIGLTFKNPVLAGCAGITERAKTAERWLKTGAAGVLAKTITTDEKLRTYIRPVFYPLNKYGLKGAMTESEFLSTIPPDKWAKEEAPRFADLMTKYNARWIQSIVGRGLEYDDWASLAQLVESAGAEGIELDLCCPLAPGESEEYKTIQLGEDPVVSAKLTAAVKKAVSIPVGVKLSPTVLSLGRVAEACRKDGGADFCSAVNAPAGFHIDVEKEEIYGANTFVGYLPGPSLKWWGLWKVTQIRDACDIEIAGVGGIWNADDALQYIMLGCRIVEVVTAVYFDGPQVFTRIIEGIEKFMDKKGYSSIEDFRGKMYEKLKAYREIPKEKVITLAPTAIEPLFDTDTCIWCGKCETSCIHAAIELNEATKSIKVDKNECAGCGFCAGICPVGAVKIIHSKTGRVIWTGEGRIETDWVNW